MSEEDDPEPLARKALLVGLVPLVGVLALPLGWVARRRAVSQMRGGERTALGATALGAVWLVVLLFLGLTHSVTHPTRNAAGDVTGSQEISLDDLRVGDCLAVPVQPAQQLKGYKVTADVVPCVTPHYGEVALWARGFRVAHPSTEASTRLVEARCRAAVKAYVDPSQAFDVDSAYFYPTLVLGAPPPPIGLLCVASSPDGELLTGSLGRGAGGS